MHRKQKNAWILALVVLVAATLFFAWRQQTRLEYAWEDVSYFFDPTAARAFAYGERHFDARSPQEYDLARAKYFFATTLEKDQKYPLAHHELARIAFIGSDYVLALSLIDQEFAVNPKPSPSSYYVRALIKGYSGDYLGAAKDYEEYFKVTPANWAAINDYSWVLLKANLPNGAHSALTWGLKQWPDNPWLLTNDATALYELGRYQEAAAQAKNAIPAVQALTVEDWLTAYPGNDPMIAQTGLDNFKKSAQENLQKILAKAGQ